MTLKDGGAPRTDIWEALAAGFEQGMVQIGNEAFAFLAAVAAIKPHNILEIGSFKGGLFLAMSMLSTGKKISIDNCEYTANMPGQKVTVEERKALQARIPDSYFINGDSTDEQMVFRVQDILGNESVDLLMIDGDHRYDGVKADFLNYVTFVAPGGWIAFHDIDDSPFARENEIDVPRFWKELTDGEDLSIQEVIEINVGAVEGMGIGMVKVS